MAGRIVGQTFVFIKLSTSFSHSLPQAQARLLMWELASSKEASRVPDPFPIVREPTQCMVCIDNNSTISEEHTVTLCRSLNAMDHIDRHLRRCLTEPYLIFFYILSEYLINHYINLL